MKTSFLSFYKMTAFNKFYSSFLRSIILPMGDLVLGSGYNEYLYKWRRYDQFSEKDLQKLQLDRLKNILDYSRTNVPFYKKKIGKKIEDPQLALKNLPVLSKDLLNSNRDNLISTEFKIENLKQNFSSGSTGKQSFSYIDPKLTYYNQAIQRHWFEWTGYREGNSVLQFGISPERGFVKLIKDFFFNVSYENAFALGNADFERIFEILKRKRINYIIGYPSAIYEFAKWMDFNGKTHKIKAIMSLGDKLFDHYVSLFDKVFKQPGVLDTYGCAEGFLMAAKFDIPYYYISSPHVYIEIVDEFDNEVEDGEIGHVLVTCLTSFAQPFLRYKVGDLAIKLKTTDYPKQRNFNYPLLKKIIGRETDVIKTPTGDSLIVHSFTGIFEFYPSIEQYKIVQIESDHLKVEYISAGVNDQKIISELNSKLIKLTKNTMTIEFLKVDNISPMKSGKPQIIEILKS